MLIVSCFLRNCTYLIVEITCFSLTVKCIFHHKTLSTLLTSFTVISCISCHTWTSVKVYLIYTHSSMQAWGAHALIHIFDNRNISNVPNNLFITLHKYCFNKKHMMQRTVRKEGSKLTSYHIINNSLLDTF